MRGTRLSLGRGARIEVPRGCRIIIGKTYAAGTACALDMRSGARLTIHGQGKVAITRGTRIIILDGAHLEIGGNTAINYDVAITCLQHIRIGSNCAIAWDVNILDGNAHEVTVAGIPRPRSTPVHIGSNVWIGARATVIGASIGDGSVVGSGSVVVSDVPSEVAAAGSPARIIRKDVSWRW